MKDTFIILHCALPSIACVVGAILLALNGIPGWGWFLFIAMITAVTGLSIK